MLDCSTAMPHTHAYSEGESPATFFCTLPRQRRGLGVPTNTAKIQCHMISSDGQTQNTERCLQQMPTQTHTGCALTWHLQHELCLRLLQHNLHRLGQVFLGEIVVGLERNKLRILQPGLLQARLCAHTNTHTHAPFIQACMYVHAHKYVPSLLTCVQENCTDACFEHACVLAYIGAHRHA